VGATRRDDALFLALLALLATALEYRFGLGNQTEQLPLVLHALHPERLADDFYVRSAQGFGPRFYYVWLLTALVRWLPLPLVMLGLTLVVNASLAAVTYLAARDLLRGERLAGLLAAILTLSVESFPLGLVTDIRFQDLQPGSLAIPFCLASLWAGMRGLPVRAAALAAVGSLPHPLYGVETGGLALGSAACVALLRLPPGSAPARAARALAPCLAGGALLGVAALLFWGLPWIGANSMRLPRDEFIAVLGFRSPHHYLPSTFPPAHYVQLAAFLGACGIAGWHWRRSDTFTRTDLAYAFAPAAVLLLCVGGIVFVEWWPSRLWITAQPFRLLYLVKWQGFLLLAWLLAGWIHEASPPRVALAWIVYFGNGAAQSLIALGGLSGERIEAWLRRRRPALSPWLLPVLALLAGFPLLLLLGKPREALALFLAWLLLLCLGFGAGRARRAVAVALVAGVVGFVAANRWLRITDWEVLLPVVSFADQRGDDADVARWAGAHTPADAIFDVPPGMGSFRLIAERAVVVDFKALPFPDAALREWHTRMRDAYGEVPGGGFAALARMETNHRGVSDQRLDAIARRYGASYAVLYADTPTRHPVLYENDSYKIVAL
jgi:hypothetical protein